MVAVYHPEESAPWGLLVNTNKIDVPEGLNGARCGSAAGPKTAPDITARVVEKELRLAPAVAHVDGYELKLRRQRRRLACTLRKWRCRVL
mgnify:CR=1 FL=1